MAQFLVRKATLADLDILYGFEQKIIRAERPFDTTLDKDPISYYGGFGRRKIVGYMLKV